MAMVANGTSASKSKKKKREAGKLRLRLLTPSGVHSPFWPVQKRNEEIDNEKADETVTPATL